MVNYFSLVSDLGLMVIRVEPLTEAPRTQGVSINRLCVIFAFFVSLREYIRVIREIR